LLHDAKFTAKMDSIGTSNPRTVVKREGQDDFWLAIGAAFPHQSGDGFNVILQALPLPSGGV
jgi:hypothetical protein